MGTTMEMACVLSMSVGIRKNRTEVNRAGPAAALSMSRRNLGKFRSGQDSTTQQPLGIRIFFIPSNKEKYFYAFAVDIASIEGIYTPFT
jgi:hypothetical protein